MAQTVLPNAARIKELRIEVGMRLFASGDPRGNAKGWTQRELADQCLLAVSTIENIESGRKLIRESTIAAVALVLGVPIDELILDWNLDITQAIELDIAGRSEDAERYLLPMIERSSPGSPDKLALEAQQASFLDHQGRLEAAMSRLESALSELDEETLEEDRRTHYWWVRYQRGVVRGRLAERECRRTFGRVNLVARDHLERARAELLEVVKAGSGSLRIAAQHQLGVLALLEGKNDAGMLQNALEIFESCREERLALRSSAHTPTFREAYEYRRIGQVTAMQGRAKDSETAFRKAIEIAREVDHVRLIQEIEDDMRAFRF